MRSAGQAKRSAGCRCARTKLAMPAMRAKKKPAGVGHPTGFHFGLKDGPPGTRGPGSSTRTTPRIRRTTPRRQRMRRKEDVLVRGSCPDLQKGQAKNKKPGGSRPTGSCGTQEAEPPGAKALVKQFGAIGAQRNCRNCAGHRCVLRGQELLHGAVRWSIFGGRRLTPRWRSGNWSVARTQLPGTRTRAHIRSLPHSGGSRH